MAKHWKMENPALAAVWIKWFNKLFHLLISLIKPHHSDERKKNVYVGPPCEKCFSDDKNIINIFEIILAFSHRHEIKPIRHKLILMPANC